MKKNKYLIPILLLTLLIPTFVLAETTINEGINEINDTFSITIALFMEAFISIHMSAFVLFPISQIISQKNANKIFSILFILRIIILLIFDLNGFPAICIIDFISVFIGAFIVVPLLYSFKTLIFNSINKDNVLYDSSKYKDISIEELSSFNIDNVEDLKNEFFNLFKRFEESYNDLDYNTMKFLSSDEIYENYKTGIDILNKKNEKRIISNIELKKSYVTNYYSTSFKQILTFVFKIEYINYIQNKDGKIISGSNYKPIKETFKVSFKKDFNKEIKVDRCPNCGAPITSNTCKYCDSTFKNAEYKIYEIQKILKDDKD